MEDLWGPLISVVILVGSGILQSRSHKKNDAPKKKSTLASMLSDQLDRMNQLGQQNTYNDTQNVTEVDEEAQQIRYDQIESLETELHVDSDIKSKQLRERSYELARTLDKDKKPMAAKAKPSKKLTLKNRLNNTGLRQSIVMAEVLGTPRSKKPHSKARH